MSLKVDLVSRTHCRLQVQASYVLPLLLEQTNKKVNAQRRVLHDLLPAHLHIRHRCAQAEHFLHLELDRGSRLVNLVCKIVVRPNERWEFACSVQARSEQTGDLLDQRARGEEDVEGLCKLAHLLLVLVQLLQVVHAHSGNVWVGGAARDLVASVLKRQELLIVVLRAKQAHL